jgi:hypothetical protein
MRCWTIATLLFPLACYSADLTQVTIPGGAARPQAATIGFTGDTTALLHIHGLALFVDPPAGAAETADLVLVTQPPAWHAITGQGRPLQTWDRLAVRKGRTRLHITALPARHGRQPALMLDFGPRCRILVHGGTLQQADIQTVPRHYPGARLALLRDADGPLLMTITDDGTAVTLQREQPLRIGPACGGKAR